MSLKDSVLIIDAIRNAQGAIKKSPYKRSDRKIDFNEIKRAVDDSMSQKKTEAAIFKKHKPVLENIVENPELKLANLPFLRDVEENQILVESLLSREKFVAPRQPIE